MKCSTKCVAKLLVIVGGVNWGLVGLAQLLSSGSNWNVVNLLLGGVPVLESVVYLLVGVSAVFLGVKCAQKCSDGSCSGGACGTDKKMDSCCK